ncbi:MAG: hypothetical protein KDA41_12220 [Planctomycetales bacterium]|nr:hypothetical protein [Planctomycetales bacterium]
MFGKPEWFKPKTFGWGLTPVTWQGWVYTLIWLIALTLPFNLLLWVRGAPEAVIWLVAGIAFLCFDVYLILKAMHRKEEEKEVFMIMDEEETRRDEIKTGKFEMRVAGTTQQQS